MKSKILAIVALALIAFMIIPAVSEAQTNTPTNTFTLTHTATPTATPTVTNTPPTPNDNEATNARIRDLNAHNPRLGDTMYALWHGRQTGGTLSANSTAYDIAATTYMADGIYVSDDGATSQSLSGINTTSSQFRKVTVCGNRAGTYRSVAGAVVTSSQADAPKAPCAIGEAEIGYLELPHSFTGASTSVTSDMCKQATAAAVSLGQF